MWTGRSGAGHHFRHYWGHESLNTVQGYIDATANATRQAARANRSYQTLRQLDGPST